MKRFRKAVHVVLVWVSICLLMVDPAAACRWLAGRRCCRGSCSCACECQPSSCSGDSAPLSGAGEAWQSEAPPGLGSGTGLTPQLQLSDFLPSFENTQPSAIDGPSTAATPTVPTIGAVPPPPANPPPAARPARPATIEPAFAMPPSGTLPRQPTSRAPQPVADVTPPAAANANRAIPAAPPAVSMPTTLSPRPSTEPVVSEVTPPNVTPQMPAASRGEVASPTTRRTNESPMRVDAARPGTNLPKSPATPANTQPPAPVSPPAFPPVDDDPFAPLNPGSQRTPTTRPNEDDPFAPIGSQSGLNLRSEGPIARDRVAAASDGQLVPASDGRLPLRQWNDNSGQFRVAARLVLILDGKVRLLKETGRTTTVPMERLSAADRAFVAEVVGLYGNDLTKLDQLAAK
jgi:hypothetical protein